MNKLFHNLGYLTSLGGGIVVVLLQKPLWTFVSTDSDGYVPPFNSSAFALDVAIVTVVTLLFAYLLGLLQGWSFGAKSALSMASVAVTPVALYWLLLTIVTYFVALPVAIVVAAFWWLFVVGLRRGAKLQGACKYVS